MLLVTFMVLSFSYTLQGQITIENTTNNESSIATDPIGSTTFAHDRGIAANTLTLVAVQLGRKTTINGTVTYGGSVMTQVGITTISSGSGLRNTVAIYSIFNATPNATPGSQNEGVFYLFTHGKPSQLLINDKWLEKEAIAQFINLEFKIQNLEFLNIYGYNYAKGEKGLEAPAYLEKQLGISIAVSTNVNGKDGDWNLEAGNQFFSALAVSNYKYNLQTTITSDNFSNGNSSGGSGWLNNWTSTGGELFMDGGSPLDVARRPVNLSTVSSAQLSLSGRFEDSNSDLNT